MKLVCTLHVSDRANMIIHKK